jgi:hypothetical protein
MNKQKKEDGFFHCPPTDLRGYAGTDGCEVMYAASYEYNGGTAIGDKWYKGYKVPPPYLPAGYKLVGIGVGLELNATPPLATARLVPIERK